MRGEDYDVQTTLTANLEDVGAPLGGTTTARVRRLGGGRVEERGKNDSQNAAAGWWYGEQ